MPFFCGIFIAELNPKYSNKYGLSFVAFLSNIKSLFKAFGGPEKGHLNFFTRLLSLVGPIYKGVCKWVAHIDDKAPMVWWW